MLAPSFNADHMPVPSQKYVAWVDVMGSGSTMSRSLHRAANFVFKLHVAALETANPHGLGLYPMNDGLYVVGGQFDHVSAWLGEFMQRLGLALQAANNNAEHMFLCRGAVAHGYVVEGKSLATQASQSLASHATHRDSILLGGPVSAAYRAEELAPPFGVFIHESARHGQGPNGNPFIRPPFLRYWPIPRPDWVARLHQDVSAYLTYCGNHKYELGYARDRLALHCELADEYFL
jgi:hypothetical protein